MAVYDAFMFFNEFDLLSVRLQEHDPFVDCFILVQADRTHAGIKREPLFSIQDPRFAKYAHKIRVVNVTLEENPHSAWDNEGAQRQAIFSAVNYLPEDIVYLSDVDEIVSRHHWKYLLKRMEKEQIISVWLQLFYYFINLEVLGVPWSHAKIMKAKVFLGNNISGTTLRCSPHTVMTPFPCGWHFSYVMTIEQIAQKITAYAHQENNTLEFKDPKNIRRALIEKKDLFNRDIAFKTVPVDSTWPLEMMTDHRWKNFICPMTKRAAAFSKIATWFIKNPLTQITRNQIVRFVKPLVSKWRKSSDIPDLYNSFSSAMFEQLILARPKQENSAEWSRLIEFFSISVSQFEGWFSARQCAELFLKIISTCGKNSRIVEVGSWKGRSSIFASRAAAVIDSTLYCVDSWEGSILEGPLHPTVTPCQQAFLEFQNNITRYGCDNVVVCKGISSEVAAKWSHGPIDLLFIDAGHDYQSVLTDLKAWVPLVKAGGIICGDDWNLDEVPHLQGSVRKAFQDFFKSTVPNMGIVERFWIHKTA